ncbi:hypothetical protein KC19_1G267900 [Ceratodon purpureus]|uniref:Uncharacterized protein n=1 Tax=Ceratodon purpureus TaxID=3225 RepID=A0A8T0JC60_CERPU|nr:hypothetical protein KC19_1G267900 [Ceratodon purpureus]
MPNQSRLPDRTSRSCRRQCMTVTPPMRRQCIPAPCACASSARRRSISRSPIAPSAPKTTSSASSCRCRTSATPLSTANLSSKSSRTMMLETVL